MKCISWYEDDFGLITCGDGAIYSIWLKVQEKDDKENVNDKGVLFYSAVRIPEQNVMFAVGSNKKIVEYKAGKVEPEAEINTGYSLGQIILSANGWSLFVGTNEPNHPGTIHIYKTPFEKVMEV